MQSLYSTASIPFFLAIHSAFLAAVATEQREKWDSSLMLPATDAQIHQSTNVDESLGDADETPTAESHSFPSQQSATARNCSAAPCSEAWDLSFSSVHGHEWHGSCPPDSYRPAPFIPEGRCCLFRPGCRCSPATCKPAHCLGNEILVLESKGDGSPGTCCDRFHCEAKANLSVLDSGLKSSAGQSANCILPGRFYSDGATWLEGACQTCHCSAGVALCKRMECPSLPESCEWADIPEGSCCPQCMGCGLNHRVGSEWMADACTNCTCGSDYRLHCEKETCKVDCDNPRHVYGQCCPVCEEPLVIEEPSECASLELCPLRCVSGYRRNQWGCYECDCADETIDGNGEVDQGNSIIPTPSLSCAPLTEHHCPKQCAHGYLRDHRDCPVCRCAKCPPIEQCYKRCLHGFQSNVHGCPICKCKTRRDQQSNTADFQDPINHLSAFTQSGTTPSAGCVTIVHSRNSNGSFAALTKVVERDSGEWWTDSFGDCRQCFCVEGREYCSLVACAPKPDWCPAEGWSRHSSSSCCPTCATLPGDANPNSAEETPTGEEKRSSISSGRVEENVALSVCNSPGDGRLFIEGETWQLTECVACTCRMGRVLCSSRQCPPLPCTDPIADPRDGGCCRRCPTNTHETSANQVKNTIIGDSALLDADGFSGCYDANAIGGPLHREAGAEWRLDECTSCWCSSNGRIDCFKESCGEQTSACRSTTPTFAGGTHNNHHHLQLMLKGVCCPICIDKLSPSPHNDSHGTCRHAAAHGGPVHIYTEGEIFRTGPCKNCTCLQSGKLECLSVDCPKCSSIGTTILIENLEPCCPPCGASINEEQATPHSHLKSFEAGEEKTIVLEKERRRKMGGYMVEKKQSIVISHMRFLLPSAIVGLILLLAITTTCMGCMLRMRRGQKPRKVDSDPIEKRTPLLRLGLVGSGEASKKFENAPPPSLTRTSMLRREKPPRGESPLSDSISTGSYSLPSPNSFHLLEEGALATDRE